MISQNKIKLFRALQLKKRRDAEGLFVAEGRKTVSDLMRGGLLCSYVAATPDLLPEFSSLCNSSADYVEASADQIAEVSGLQTRSEVIAIFRKPVSSSEAASASFASNDLVLALDEIQDPGNLGTILRTADWFGIRTVVCSLTCADAYGPKAVQASMGALCRVVPVYVDLHRYLSDARQSDVPVYGTFLAGDNIYDSVLSRSGVILMGNEGRGVSPRNAELVSRKLFIPSYPPGAPTSESLNVSTATAIVCSEFRRRF